MSKNHTSKTNPGNSGVYKGIEIGNQVWMTENLSIANYRNGDPVKHVSDPEAWGDQTVGAWCYYMNDPSLERLYGRLYNWFAVDDPRGLAPKGWRIPSDEDWKKLEKYLGLAERELGATGWRGGGCGLCMKQGKHNLWKGNISQDAEGCGFEARPGGYRDVDGSFYVLGSSGYWWTATEYDDFFAWYRSLYYNVDKIHRLQSYEGDGFSVRCIRED
jgi:uncharacterized protein (TIGR02145 family)